MPQCKVVLWLPMWTEEIRRSEVLGELRLIMDEGVLHIEEHLKEAFITMNNLRNHQELCDVVLCVGNTEIHAHRLVLASCSPYFYAMFTNNLAESKQSVVTLKGMDPKCVEGLVQFAYTADIVVNERNVQALLPVASLLQIACVQKACCTFLERQLDPTNCLGILSFAELYGCDELASKSRHYYSRYFSKVSRAEEFLWISEDRLCSLMDGDGLCVKNEDEVLLAAIRWMKHDLQNRRHSLIRLLSHVRLPFVSPGFMQSLCKSTDFTDIELLELLSDVYESCSTKALNMKKRCPLGPQVMYIVGGYLRQSLKVVECYYPHHNSWNLLKSLQQPRSGAGAAFVGGMLYIIGGRNNSLSGNVDCDSVDRYDPLLDEWKSVCSLTVPRNRAGIGVIDGYVYAIGGSHGNLYLNLVEKYDADEDSWVEVAPLIIPRIGAGVAVMDRKLYAVGGFDGVRRLDSVECYDPKLDKWTLVCSMNSARSGAAVDAANGYIYALGGYNGTTQLSSVERYDPKTNEWTLVSCMLDHRSALSVASFEKKLYVFGGYDGEKFHDTVEVYDCEQDRWEIATSMSMGRSGAAVAVGVRPVF